MKLLADIVPLDANPLVLIAAGVSIGVDGNHVATRAGTLLAHPPRPHARWGSVATVPKRYNSKLKMTVVEPRRCGED